MGTGGLAPHPGFETRLRRSSTSGSRPPLVEEVALATVSKPPHPNVLRNPTDAPPSFADPALINDGSAKPGVARGDRAATTPARSARRDPAGQALTVPIGGRPAHRVSTTLAGARCSTTGTRSTRTRAAAPPGTEAAERRAASGTSTAAWRRNERRGTAGQRPATRQRVPNDVRRAAAAVPTHARHPAPTPPSRVTTRPSPVRGVPTHGEGTRLTGSRGSGLAAFAPRPPHAGVPRHRARRRRSDGRRSARRRRRGAATSAGAPQGSVRRHGNECRTTSGAQQPQCPPTRGAPHPPHHQESPDARAPCAESPREGRRSPHRVSRLRPSGLRTSTSATLAARPARNFLGPRPIRPPGSAEHITSATHQRKAPP